MSERPDPSVNTLRLIDDSVKYFEKMLKQNQEFNEAKLQNAVEASRRERSAETARIDACRRDDTDAVKVAQTVAAKQAEVLASQMAENAEALRASMAKTAETLAAQLQQVTASLDARLQIVEKNQYTTAGSSKGSRDMWGWISAGVILLIAIIGFVTK